ncbi:MAG: hypothetical protein II099_01465, partial [Firmicutes bacterium]|nr:hypothetical protein [Bacillota bacterium]
DYLCPHNGYDHEKCEKSYQKHVRKPGVTRKNHTFFVLPRVHFLGYSLPTNLRLILVFLNEAVKQLISLRLKLKKCNPAVNPGSSPALNQNDKSKAPLLRGLINGADNRT